MKADNKNDMLALSLEKLKAEEGTPFPLYVFLQKNDRYVLIRRPGDPIGLAKYEEFVKRHLKELYVPKSFSDVLTAYLKGGAESIETVPPAKDAPAGATVVDEAPAETPKSEEAQIVADVFKDEELTSEEKAEVLSALSQDLLRSLNQITTRGEDARSKGLQRCREIADEILNVAAQNSNIYDEILALRSSQEDIEHSIIVGTISVMFGLAIGMVDENILADLTIAAIFHDIGLVKVAPGIIAKPERTWSAAERQEYERHVQASLDTLKESSSEFHPRVFRLIKEHHENYDGSGFPAGLKGVQIDELSQLLHLANLFDRLCTGKQMEKDLSPAEAFDYIYETSQKPDSVQEVQPELVERVFQFMLEEKGAAEELQNQAAERTKAVMDQVSKGS